MIDPQAPILLVIPVHPRIAANSLAPGHHAGGKSTTNDITSCLPSPTSCDPLTPPWHSRSGRYKFTTYCLTAPPPLPRPFFATAHTRCHSTDASRALAARSLLIQSILSRRSILGSRPLSASHLRGYRSWLVTLSWEPCRILIRALIVYGLVTSCLSIAAGVRCHQLFASASSRPTSDYGLGFPRPILLVSQVPYYRQTCL